MKKVLAGMLVMVFLASAVLLTVAPVSASPAGTSEEYKKLFEGDNKITRGEIASAITSYMLGGGSLKLEELRNAAHVYAYWNGKPKTITDSLDRTVTIYKPIKKIIAIRGDTFEALTVLGARDKIVGIGREYQASPKLFPEISELPSVGDPKTEINYEAVIGLEPDIVTTPSYYVDAAFELESKVAEAGIAVIAIDLWSSTSTMKENMRKLAYLLEAEENFTRWLNWVEKYEQLVDSRVSEIPEKEKVKVYTCGASLMPTGAFAEGTIPYDLSVMAGGNNTLQGVKGYPKIDPENVIYSAPDVIIGRIYHLKYASGYDAPDKSELIKFYDDIMEVEGWEEVPAVANERVYIIEDSITYRTSYPVALVAIANALYPELFEDVKPIDVHQEYVDDFLGAKFDVRTRGAFFYPDFPW